MNISFRIFSSQLSVRHSKILYRRISTAIKKVKVPHVYQPIWRKFAYPSIRQCFHPGASTLVPLKDLGKIEVSGWELVRKILGYVWPKGNWLIKKRVIFAMALLVIAKILNVMVPFLLKDVINYFNGKAPAFMKLGVDSPSQTIVTVGISIILAYGFARVGSSLFNELRNAVFSRVAQNSVRNIARNVFLHLHSLDLSYHLSRQTGALSKAIDRGTRGLAFVLNALVFNVVPTVVEVSMVTAIFYMNCGMEFALATLGCLSSYSLATFGITRWRTRFRHEMNQADNDAGNKAIDSLINYETVKYFNNEKFEADRYDQYLRIYEGAALKTSTSLALLNFAQNTIFSAGLIAVMCLAANNILNGTMSVGDLILANTLLFQLSIPLNFLGSVYREVRQGLIDMQTMFSLLHLKSAIHEKPGAPSLNVSTSNSTIVFKNIHFGYLPGKKILDGLSFEVPAGKKVAIVGGSGSGKSTVVRLLYRLFDAESGEILINNQKITDVSLESLRKNIAIVPQDSVLFHDTLFYNLQYGKPNASKEEVYRVCRMANLHDSILNFKEKYDTIVGERGLKISGGEKQRVAIARAILKDSPIIIYDEATSSLDALTEEIIMNSMKCATEKKTSLFIAHRLATIVDADIIYVLEDGKILESGNHFELMNIKGSRYAELWNSQHKYADSQLPRKEAESEHLRHSREVQEMLILDDDGCCRTGNCNS